MEIREELTMSRYLVVENRRSRIDPEAIVRVEVCLRCPRCKRVGPVIRHGKTERCGCGLEMTVHGNCLTCVLRKGPVLFGLLGKGHQA